MSAVATSSLHYWLVGNPPGTHIAGAVTGTDSKVVTSAGKPKGYSTAFDLGAVAGADLRSIEQKIGSLLPSLPTGIKVQTGGYDIPGLGHTGKVKGPGGIAGTLDSGATAAGTGVQGVLTVAQLFTSPSLWKGIGLALAGAILVILGLAQFLKRTA